MCKTARFTQFSSGNPLILRVREPANSSKSRTASFVEKLVENRRICLEFSGFLRTFAVRKKDGVPEYRC